MGVQQLARKKSKKDNASSGEDADQKLLDQLNEVWSSHGRTGLEARHKMGVLLQSALGPPDEHQAHGSQILKKAAERLKISESELSRMRWLASLYPTVDMLQTLHSECRNWTEFKRELPRLKRAGQEATITERKPQKTKLERIRSAIRRTLSRFQEADPDEDRKLYRVLVNELREAVRLGRRRLNELPKELPNLSSVKKLKVLAYDTGEKPGT